MVKVITYGTYDLLHFGHIRLLERAKALGDYLIVGVTSDDYDKSRGKINNQQSLMERINAVKATGLADEVIIEEYEGQKIDDIKRYGVDIFTLGSDWQGKFDYLNEYCKVVYLPRTEGISSSKIRTEKRQTKLGILSNSKTSDKFIAESQFVNGISVDYIDAEVSSYDAVYVVTDYKNRYEDVKKALLAGKHVLCEAPYALKEQECIDLINLASKNKLILMASIKTAYVTAFNRLILLAKSGKIGDILSVDATCTSIRTGQPSLFSWGPIALMPVFKLLGTDYRKKQIVTCYQDEERVIDIFTKIDFIYDHAVASIKVAKGAKSEGELKITGTKGYIFVPAPWWKTDYFEVRYEDPADNRRYFYQLDGEGIRYEIASFVSHMVNGYCSETVTDFESIQICKIMEDYINGEDVLII